MNKITHVAIEFNGKIYALPAPNRHHHVIKMIYEENGVGLHGYNVQGFLDSHGNFLNRTQALIVAKENNLLLSPEKNDFDELFSEDVW